MPTNPLSKFINAIDTRLKRLEARIGSTTDAILNFISISEDIGVIDCVHIYKRDVNDSFLIGTSNIGVARIGDRRSQPVLLYSG